MKLSNIIAFLSICGCTVAHASHPTGFLLPSSEERLGEAVYDPNKMQAPLPSSYDLRALGFVNPVKDQGACGSCWAFGATAVLESMAAKKFGKLVSLSEQEIVSCATEFGVQGCNGGNSIGAWEHTVHSPQSLESAYAYTSGKTGEDGPCKSVKDKYRMVSDAKSYLVVQNESDIKTALVDHGPVAIAISADQCFMDYESGILGPENCACNGDVNHLVVVVGYGSEAGKDFWIVRNSWSENWGEKGYVRFQMGVDQCQMMSFATIPGDVAKTKYYPKK